MVFKPDAEEIPNEGTVTLQCMTDGYQWTGGTGRILKCLNDEWQGNISICEPASKLYALVIHSDLPYNS